MSSPFDFDGTESEERFGDERNTDAEEIPDPMNPFQRFRIDASDELTTNPEEDLAPPPFPTPESGNDQSPTSRIPSVQLNMEPHTVDSVWPLRFELLPDKIVTKILNLVPNHDLEELQSVSSQFRMVIDGRVGLSVIIGTLNDDFAPTVSRINRIEKLEQVGVSNCTILNLVNVRVPQNPYRHPHLLNSLTFEGYISMRNFLILITNTPNVRYFKIFLSTLSVIEFQDISLHTYLPKLSELHVICGRDYFYECTATQWLTCIYSLIGLLADKLPNLDQFTINIPYLNKFRDMTYDFSKVLYNFLQRHRETLTRLHVIYDEVYDELAADEPEQEEQEENVMEDNFEVGELLKNLKEFTLRLMVDDDETNIPRNPQRFINKIRSKWSPVLLAQRNLQKCFVGDNIYLSKETARSLCQNNCNTLTNLNWKFQKNELDRTRLIVDLSILQNCHNLVQLRISGPTDSDLPFMDVNQTIFYRPRFTNLKKLPQKLECLSLCSCEITTGEFHVLASDFPQLKELTLDTTFRDPCGISVDSVAALLEKESLTFIVSLRSLNVNVTSDPVPTTNQITAILKALLSGWRTNSPAVAISSFALRRNSSTGLWENSPGSLHSMERFNIPPTPAVIDARSMVDVPLPLILR